MEKLELGSNDRYVTYKKEDIPSDSTLAPEFDSVICSLVTEFLDKPDSAPCNCDRCNEKGWIVFNQYPVQLSRREDGELIDVNHLDAGKKAAVKQFRKKLLTLCVEHSLEPYLDEKGKLRMDKK